MTIIIATGAGPFCSGFEEEYPSHFRPVLRHRWQDGRS
jgi:hypothetical protein